MRRDVGYVRLTVVILLSLAIGALGAILLPGRVHEPPAPEPATLSLTAALTDVAAGVLSVDVGSGQRTIDLDAALGTREAMASLADAVGRHAALLGPTLSWRGAASLAHRATAGGVVVTVAFTPATARGYRLTADETPAARPGTLALWTDPRVAAGARVHVAVSWQAGSPPDVLLGALATELQQAGWRAAHEGRALTVTPPGPLASIGATWTYRGTDAPLTAGTTWRLERVGP
jgi:hypothetical protein